MTSKKILSGALFTALSLSLGGVAGAQETTSGVRGEVTDTEGEPIGGAQVTVTHVPSGTRAVTRTNEDGTFDARGLRVGGPYTLEFSAPEFQGERVEGVFLTLGGDFRVTADLEPESSGEIVVVGVRSRGVETVGSATELNRDGISRVVSVNRDVRDLARRDPLVSQDVGANRGGGGQGGISIAGSAPRQNRITIDGVQASDDFGLNTGGLSSLRGPISIDAVEAFTVQATPFDVTQGDFNGGSIDMVLRSGNNAFEGSVFANYLAEGLVGERFGDTRATVTPSISNAIVDLDNYGAFLSGPILRDRVFFALSYEDFDSVDVTGRGPLGGGFANGINDFNGASNAFSVADVNDINAQWADFAVSSQFEAGGMPLSQSLHDTKFSARFDWNISDRHRASLTWREVDSSVVIRNGLGNSTSAGLQTNWYSIPEQESVAAVQVNSDWTDNFSTELRASYRDYIRGQNPSQGQNAIGQVEICYTDIVGSANSCSSTNNSPTVFFGPDVFRHANGLWTTNAQFQGQGEYSWGDHRTLFGAQWQRINVVNLFVPRSDGQYYFDTYADFTTPDATLDDGTLNSGGAAPANTYQLGRFQYGNSLTGNPSDAEVDFAYQIFTLMAQDSWDITPALTINYGVRWDLYQMSDRPAYNPFFAGAASGQVGALNVSNVGAVNRPGYSNQTTYDGLDVLMPRFSFSYNPTDQLEISGGIGLFAGGIPDVFISNIFGNTGVLTNGIDIRRDVTAAAGDGACFDNNNPSRAFTQAECDALLRIDGASLNAFRPPSAGSLAQQLVSGTAPNSSFNPAGETNAFAPDFEMPSDWRGSLRVRYDLNDNWRVGLDVVGTRSNTALAFRDDRAHLLTLNGVQQLLPDGRLRYDRLNIADADRDNAGGGLNLNTGISTNVPGGSNRDIVAYNPDENSWSVTTALSFEASWDNGVSLGGSYTHQVTREFGSFGQFATTASGLYGEQLTANDPNGSTLGRSANEIENGVRFNAGWTHQFVRDLDTRFSVFADWRTGRPINFLMSQPNSGTSVFGVNRSDHLLYVPRNLFAAPTVLGDGSLLIPNSGATPGTGVVFTSSGTTTAQQNLDRFRQIVQTFGLSEGIVERSPVNNPDIFRIDMQIAQDLPGFRAGHRTRLQLDMQNVLNMLNDEWGVVEEYTDSRTGGRVVDVQCGNGTSGASQSSSSTVCTHYNYSNTNNSTFLSAPTRNADLSRWYVQVGLRYEF